MGSARSEMTTVKAKAPALSLLTPAWEIGYGASAWSAKSLSSPKRRKILPKVYEAFDFVLCRLDAEIFDGERAVRDLTIRYVVLQLLSDASFCLDRWQSKGGGSSSREGNHHRHLEKWLWRSLWDLFVASDVVDRLIGDGAWG